MEKQEPIPRKVSLLEEKKKEKLQSEVKNCFQKIGQKQATVNLFCPHLSAFNMNESFYFFFFLILATIGRKHFSIKIQKEKKNKKTKKNSCKHKQKSL